MHPDLICFSHLRWDFVFQRPNHLMVRAARDRRVIYVEEPVADGHLPARMERRDIDGVTVLTPRLPETTTATAQPDVLRGLLDTWLAEAAVVRPVLWYYTPMALPWTVHLDAAAVVYDCMDHLAGFRGAPEGLLRQEARLIARADLLFTGGARLHELKRQDHADAHCFPSSVDAAHFRTARRPQPDPEDQAGIPRPRVGYAGVIDERLDMTLLDALAVAEPRWQLVLVGPVVKIDPADVPAHPNIHQLGMRDYRQLPAYLSGWDLAIMPFAHNDATAYISPTKTPEYLAAGLPVASTSIRDVVRPFGVMGMVEIGDGPDGFVAACRRAMDTDRMTLRGQVDAYLAERSWDRTWAEIDALLTDAVRRRRSVPAWTRPSLATADAVRPGPRLGPTPVRTTPVVGSTSPGAPSAGPATPGISSRSVEA